MPLRQPDFPIFTARTNAVSQCSNNITHGGKIRATVLGRQTKVSFALTGGSPHLQKYDTLPCLASIGVMWYIHTHIREKMTFCVCVYMEIQLSATISNNINHLVTMPGPAGKPWVLAFMHQPMKWRCGPSTPPHGNGASHERVWVVCNSVCVGGQVVCVK